MAVRAASEARSCWTDAYAGAHCEGYRVHSETGEHLGWVDRVEWSEDGREPEALVVESVTGDCEVVVRLGRVVEILPRDERIVVVRAVAELLRATSGRGRERTT
jgi:hypothetical protein